jgi:beta-galactosidase
VTQVYINGIDMGTSVECYTPIEMPITRALKFGEENEILIKVGDRFWLPPQAAGSTDKEKEHYLPGIWDDVELIVSGDIQVNNTLISAGCKKREGKGKGEDQKLPATANHVRGSKIRNSFSKGRSL